MSDLYFSESSEEVEEFVTPHALTGVNVINEVRILHLLRAILNKVKMAQDFGGLKLEDCNRIELGIFIGRKDDAKPLGRIES